MCKCVMNFKRFFSEMNQRELFLLEAFSFGPFGTFGTFLLELFLLDLFVYIDKNIAAIEANIDMYCPPKTNRKVSDVTL